jgi:hypothetical protein
MDKNMTAGKKQKIDEIFGSNVSPVIFERDLRHSFPI